MRLGEYQELYYVKKVDFGIYLAEDLTSETHVLLPAKQVPEDAKAGEKIRVFFAGTGRRFVNNCGKRSGKNRRVS